MEVLGRIETDQGGHDGQQLPFSGTLVRGLAHGLALQVAQGADLLFPEDLVTPEVQAA